MLVCVYLAVIQYVVRSFPWWMYKINQIINNKRCSNPCIFGICAYFCLSNNDYLNKLKIQIMNKGQLIAKIAEDASLTKAQATSALEAVIDGVTGALKAGDKLTLVGFGTFSISARAARKGRNPSTGESINIAAKNVVKFKAGKDLNSKVN